MSQGKQLHKGNYYYCRKCVRFRLLDDDDMKVIGDTGKPMCSEHDIEMEKYA
jgi:hypothetical protein